MTYNSIASIVGKSIFYCWRVCQQMLTAKNPTTTKSIMKSRSKKLLEAQQIILPSKLNTLHLQHLTSQATLQR